MLGVAKLRLGGEDYYLATTPSRARTLVESDGIWFGHALDTGLDEVPDGDRLGGLFAGIDPSSGEVLDARHARVKNVAFDCTFSAPKSASVLFALGKEPVANFVLDAHQQAVRAVLSYLEDRASFVRRGPTQTVLRATGHVGAMFVHRTSRASDPHLHTGIGDRAR